MASGGDSPDLPFLFQLESGSSPFVVAQCGVVLMHRILDPALDFSRFPTIFLPSDRAFCRFLHSPCWLYPVIRFFGHAIDKFEELEKVSQLVRFGDHPSKMDPEKLQDTYASYCDLVGSLLLAFCKDQRKDLNDVITEAANLCKGKEYKPTEVVRQDVVNFLRAALKLEYFSYTLTCYNNLFELTSFHDTCESSFKVYDEMFKAFLFYMVERAESYVESVKDLPQLHLGPFLCLYGINQHDPKHNFDLTLGKHLHQIHQRLDPREPKIEELKQIFSKLEVVDKEVVKEGASPGASADAKSKDYIKVLPYQREFPSMRTEVRKMKMPILNASLDDKATVFCKVFELPQYLVLLQRYLPLELTEFKAVLRKSSYRIKPQQPLCPSDSELSQETKRRNDRMNKNISCLEMLFQLRTCVEEWPNVKIAVDKYADDMRPKEKSKHHGGQSDPLFKDIKEPRDVIDMLKSAFKQCR